MEPDNEHDHKMADLAETLKGFSVGGSRAVAVRPKPPDQHWQPWRWGDEILPLLVALRNIDERAPEVLDYWEKYYRARHKGISKDDPRWLLVSANPKPQIIVLLAHRSIVVLISSTICR